MFTRNQLIAIICDILSHITKQFTCTQINMLLHKYKYSTYQ